MGMLTLDRLVPGFIFFWAVLCSSTARATIVTDMGIFDRVIFEPSLGYRFDAEQANTSGFSHGPQVGFRVGLGYQNIFSAIDVSGGLLLGFPSISYPFYIGLAVGGRLSQGSPYSFTFGFGEEAIYGARTQEEASMPFYFKVKGEAQYYRPSGSALGVSVSYAFFSEVFPGNTVSYTPVSAVFFMSWPLHSGVVK